MVSTWEGSSPTVTEDGGLSHTQLSVVTSARQGWRAEDFEGSQMWSGLGQATTLAQITCAVICFIFIWLLRCHTSGP